MKKMEKADILRFVANSKYITELLHLISKSDNSKTQGDLENEFQNKYPHVEIKNLNNQFFAPLRLLSLLFIREDVKNSDKEPDKEIVIVRHSLAHGTFEIRVCKLGGGRFRLLSIVKILLSLCWLVTIHPPSVRG